MESEFNELKQNNERLLCRHGELLLWKDVQILSR